jgi:hypothetical protein
MAANESDRLDAVTVNWDEATSTLLAHALPVVRVEESFPTGLFASFGATSRRPSSRCKRTG